jgi:hypothetical protein
MPGQPLPDRAELGDTDQTLWSLGLNGKPEDPWKQYAKLILGAMANGEQISFGMTAITARISAGQLARDIVWGRQARGNNAIAVIEIQTRSVPTKYGRTIAPDFPIVDWIVGNGSEPKALPSPDPTTKEPVFKDAKELSRAQQALKQRLTNKSDEAKAEKPSPTDDLDDEIIF